MGTGTNLGSNSSSPKPPSEEVETFHISQSRGMTSPHSTEICDSRAQAHFTTLTTVWVKKKKKFINRWGFCHISCCYLCVRAKVLQSCPILPTPGTVARQAPLSMGILQARVLQWVAVPSSSRGSSRPKDWTPSLLSHWQAGSLPLAPPGKISATCEVKCKSLSRVPTLWPHGLQPTRLLCPWNSPGKNTSTTCDLMQILRWQIHFCNA